MSDNIAAAIKANADFNRSIHALYEAGYFAQREASESDPRLTAFRKELYAEQFDAEYDAKCQEADAYNKEGR